MSLRSQAGRVARRVRGEAPKTPWVAAEPNPTAPRPLAEVRLFGIIGTWMEADVVAATVANAFTQGCECIYLVDNDSPDDTVAEAVRAGAVLAESFATENYDEQVRLDIMNRVVRDVSETETGDHIWWLWLDADEFPHGPRGLTVREYLEQLDACFRIVGARFINHFPDQRPGYISGFHPIEFQSLCEEHLMGCALRHRKHPLQRWDRDGVPIICDRGFHRATSVERPLREPSEAIYLHHFPYREERATRQRLAAVCSTDEYGNSRAREGDDAADGMIPRFRTLDAVYTQDWAGVRNYRLDGAHASVDPVPWTTLAEPEDLTIRRWYEADELERARRELEDLGTGEPL